MFIKLLEIYEEIVNYNKAEGFKTFSIREIAINPSYITNLKNDLLVENTLRDNPKCAEGLQKQQKFTRLYLNRGNSGYEIVVLGDLDSILKLLDMNGSTNKKVIKG